MTKDFDSLVSTWHNIRVVNYVLVALNPLDISHSIVNCIGGSEDIVLCKIIDQAVYITTI